MNGPNCEVLIHDTANLKNSIVYITSPSITGRKIGGAITDFALALFRGKEHESMDSVVNYLGRSNDRVLRSSTYFIKDKGTLVGLLCVNIDITNLMEAKRLVENEMMVDLSQLYGEGQRENFHLTVDGLIEEVMKDYLGQRAVASLLPEEKRDLTHLLEKRGVFMVKGTIPTVAKLMGMSEQTIYRYLRDKPQTL